MSSEDSQPGTKQVAKVMLLGALSLALYVTLFSYEETILSLTSQGRWSFIIPISIAFIFSFAHGAFTGEFWDVLGIKAKK
jgi:hypothetical protein